MATLYFDLLCFHPVSFSISFKRLLTKSSSYCLITVIAFYLGLSSNFIISIQATFRQCFLPKGVDLRHHLSPTVIASFSPELEHRASSRVGEQAETHAGHYAGHLTLGDRSNPRFQIQVADGFRKWAELVAP